MWSAMRENRIGGQFEVKLSHKLFHIDAKKDCGGDSRPFLKSKNRFQLIGSAVLCVMT